MRRVKSPLLEDHSRIKHKHQIRRVKYHLLEDHSRIKDNNN